MEKTKSKSFEKEVRKNRFDYHFLEIIEAGIILEGWEVKSLVKNPSLVLDGAYVKVINNELFLVGSHITPQVSGNDATRFRKLLVTRRQIDYLAAKVQQDRLTIVPTALVYNGKHFKVKIALARGKNHADKREVIKQRDLSRES